MEDFTKETVNLNVCSIALLVLSGRSAVNGVAVDRKIRPVIDRLCEI
jgi:hypothetical protein